MSNSESTRPTRAAIFVGQVALSAVALSLPAASGHSAPAQPNRASEARGFLELLRTPDSVMVQAAAGDMRLTQGSSGHWSANDVVVTTTPSAGTTRIALTAEPTADVLFLSGSQFKCADQP